MKSDKAGTVSSDLDHSLHSLGVPVGEKILELLSHRDMKGSGACSSQVKRETKMVNMLHFINKEVFRALFGRTADGLEQSIEDEDEYRILDTQPVTNKYANMGKQQSGGGNNGGGS